MSEQDTSNTIHIERLYDAPVQAVWDAWTDTDQVAQWWGPRGFTITTHGKDLRPGGRWEYTMHGPDGVDYPNNTVYLEVVPLERLVYDQGVSDGQPAMFRVTVEFSEVDGRTRMAMSMTMPTPEATARTRHVIKHFGGNTTWDRLAEYLAKHGQDSERFVINRSVDAPQAAVFAMWTQPEQIARWMPPAGAAMRFLRADIRTGGESLYAMTMGDTTMHGRVHYEEVRGPDRIVYTQQFCDEQGNVARHPFAPAWPETVRGIVELSEEGPEQTRITLTWEIAGQATADELVAFTGARAGMSQGWTGSFDKVDEALG
jgi:uncharacterized protein YndB with AHSA1/START domain